jgi:hypothetical protein
MGNPLLAIIIGFCLTTVCTAADFDPFEGPKPIAIFIQTDPWARVINADTPRVAVYENGDVIFAKWVNDRLIYHYVSLDKDGLEKVHGRIKPVLELQELKPRYDVRPNVTDQPEAMFYFRDGDREIATSVYGLMAARTKLPAYTELPNGSKPTIPPDELLKLHKWLCNIDYPNSKEWIPKYVEVILWDYSYAPEASIHWPKEWPSLNSERTQKRGNSYSIFMDGSFHTNVREFLATRKGRGAVEIEGKKMSASYRFTFPGERAWHKAFAAAEERQESRR